MKKGGFTLIEVIIAMFVTLVAVATFSKFAFIEINANNTMKQKLEALIIAKNQIENFKSNPASLNANLGASSTNVVSQNITYTVKRQVSLLRSQSINTSIKLYEVKIQVSYSNSNPVELTTDIFSSQ